MRLRSRLAVTLLAALAVGSAPRARAAEEEAARAILLGTGDVRGWTDPCG